jgi:hypothetical protein
VGASGAREETVKRVRWYYRAREDLLAIPSVDDAAAVDGAVQYFARTGVGFVRQFEGELRLYPTSARYYVVFHADDETVYVWRIFRR